MGACGGVGCGRKRRFHQPCVEGCNFCCGAQLMRLLIGLLLATLSSSQQLTHRVVLLDGYHNKEAKTPLHYRWEGTDNGGFSQLGDVLKGLGAELRTTVEAIDASTLAGVGCLIIVDPDTPKESDHPNYISKAEVKAIVTWVNR